VQSPTCVANGPVALLNVKKKKEPSCCNGTIIYYYTSDDNGIMIELRVGIAAATRWLNWQHAW
jgi:hypothetical protein